jgi:hypothetical protein
MVTRNRFRLSAAAVCAVLFVGNLTLSAMILACDNEMADVNSSCIVPGTFDFCVNDATCPGHVSYDRAKGPFQTKVNPDTYTALLYPSWVPCYRWAPCKTQIVDGQGACLPDQAKWSPWQNSSYLGTFDCPGI